MVPKTQTDGVVGEGEDARQHSSLGNTNDSVNDRAEAGMTPNAAGELAASLDWLRGAPSSEVFSKRCKNLTAQFQSVFERVDAAFASAPESEDLLWLRDNAQELSSAARMVGNELAPLDGLPLVSRKNISSKSEIVP